MVYLGSRNDALEPKAGVSWESSSSSWFEQQISATSDASTTNSLEELSTPIFFEKQCSHIDVMTSQVLLESSIRKAIKEVVADRQVSVSVADPRSPDAYLIAVSDRFETMTGYSRPEILGKNCRFLNDGCRVNSEDLLRLRGAVKTGEPFTGVLENRRKSGELFLNLLDLHGLTVARDVSTGDDLWFLVGIQADVSELSPSKLAKAEREVHCVANDIREKLADELSALAISGALKFTVSTVSGHLRSNKPEDSDEAIWSLLPTPQWRGVGGETLSGEGLERPFAPPATVAPAKAAKSLGLLARLGWVPCTVLLAITCYGVLTRVTSRAWSGSVHPSH